MVPMVRELELAAEFTDLNFPNARAQLDHKGQLKTRGSKENTSFFAGKKLKKALDDMRIFITVTTVSLSLPKLEKIPSG